MRQPGAPSLGRRRTMTSTEIMLAAARALAARSQCGDRADRPCTCAAAPDADPPELDEAVDEWLAQTGQPSAAWEPPEVGCYWAHAARIWLARAEALAGLILARAGGAVRDGAPRPTPEEVERARALICGGDAIRRLACLRCGHVWLPRRVERPPTCPACRSPYWDRPRS